MGSLNAKEEHDVLTSLTHIQDHFVITREKFTQWLKTPEMHGLLNEIGVETATKMELFDVLDADSGGELSIEELTGGLMRLRGPITKTDIVAVRLKVRLLMDMVDGLGDLVHSLKEGHHGRFSRASRASQGSVATNRGS